MEIDRIVIVTRLTRLEENERKFNTKAQAKFFVEKRGQSFKDYEVEYDNYMFAREKIVKTIPKEIKFQVIDRNFLPNFIFTNKDLILTLGQDGLVVNTAKYLNGQKIIGVNPDTARFDGILLPYNIENASAGMHSVFNGTDITTDITMAKIELNDGQSLYAFNDFFIGTNSHISARYSIEYNKLKETQISSGVIISTPAGSTGWLSSLYNMTKGINKFSNIKTDIKNMQLNWEEKKLVFMVREPFKSKWSQTEIVAGLIKEKQALRIESFMAEKGIIFSDGMENDFIEFNSGAISFVSIADKSTKLVLNK